VPVPEPPPSRAVVAADLTKFTELSVGQLLRHTVADTEAEVRPVETADERAFMEHLRRKYGAPASKKPGTCVPLPLVRPWR
jgi:hypothetical protein